MDRTGSMFLMGLTLSCAIASSNTSTKIAQLNEKELCATAENLYGTESFMLREYPVTDNKFNVEKEDQSLFGEMREATVVEQQRIQNHIDEISVPTGVSFWD